MKIEKIVAQMAEDDFLRLSDQFKKTKADKYLLLITLYREGTVNDKEILARLDIKLPAFYTLKSRLHDKIQEHLYKTTTDSRIELLKNVANIDNLVYNIPKETAIGLLQKLEVELIKNDMPNELILVYKALKKLSLNTQKYYEYAQLYNRYVAYNLAQDKAEELVSQFCVSLTEYYVTHKSELISILTLYKKEMYNLARLHQSHRITVYKNILNIHFALFCPVAEELKNDATIEDQLKELYGIIEANPDDTSYKHLMQVIHFLSFEYYFQLGLYKNAASFYEKINDSSNSILLYNHTCFALHFLITKIEWHLIHNNLNEIDIEASLIYEPNVDNPSELSIYKHYRAALLFNKGLYAETIQCLNSLINEVSFKDTLANEIETKLFLIICLLLTKKYDQAEITLRSISRKITDADNEIKYHAALLYIKLFKTALAGKNSDKQEKLLTIYALIEATNTGASKVLRHVKLNAKQLEDLSKK